MDLVRLMAAIALCVCTTQTWASEDAKLPQVEPPGRHQEVICRKERVLGTHFRRRVCRTRAQIDQDREHARRRMQEGDRYNQATRTSTSPRGG